MPCCRAAASCSLSSRRSAPNRFGVDPSIATPYVPVVHSRFVLVLGEQKVNLAYLAVVDIVKMTSTLLIAGAAEGALAEKVRS